MSRLPIALLLAALVAVPAANAASHHKPGAGAAKASESLSEGEVRKVDTDAGKITIKHGPLSNLDMPAMTMVFQVRDRAMLEQVKAGDKVKFRAEKMNGGYTVTRIETQN